VVDLCLETIGQSAQVENLLVAFATRSGFLPEAAYRVREPRAIPKSLQKVLAELTEQVWVCYSNGSESWLLTAILSLALSHQHKTPVLVINSYDTNGALLEAAVWGVEPDGQWSRWSD
jgi:hypothetical protein